MTVELLFSVLMGAVWCGVHTPESAAAADALDKAIADEGLLDKQAAIGMGITAPQLSKQRAGREALNYWRLWSLPKSFQIARLKREAALLGCVVLSPDERACLVGAARLGPRRMAKMLPQLLSEERRSA